MPRLSPRLQRRLGLLVSVVALAAVAWWVSKQDAPRFPSSGTGYLWLLGALAVYALALAARGWRWHRIMRLADIPHERADAYRLTLVGYMGNNVLPARGGELLRIAILASRSTARRREVLGSIIAERLLDAAVLAALFAPLTWAGVGGSPAGQLPAALAAAALVLGAMALVVYLAVRRRGKLAAFHDKIAPVARALRVFAHKEGLLLALLSAAVWCFEGLTLLLIGHSLGLELSILDATLIIVLASLLAVVPAAPGYAGTFDAGLVLGLSAAGISGGLAVGFVLLTRFVMFVPVTLVGIAVLLHSYRSFGLRRRPDEEPEPVAPSDPAAVREERPAGAVSARG